MNKKNALQFLAAVVFAVGAQVAHANSYTYSFDQLTSCTEPASCSQLPGGQLGPSPWGTITFTDTAANTVRMSFTLGTNFGVGPETAAVPWNSFLYINYNSALGSGGSTLSGLAFSAVANAASGIAHTTPGNNQTQNGTAQGAYDIAFRWGNDVFNPGETSIYDITNAQAIMFTSPTNKGYVAGMEILQDGDSPGLDARIAAIPEPGTYAMMLAGLGLMGFVARRRGQNDRS